MRFYHIPKNQFRSMDMNRTTPAQRHDFYRRHLRGETYQELAEGAAVSKECVRYWCRRQRDGGQCESRYHRSPQAQLSRFSPVVRYAILRLKLAHPRWGRERIHYHLQKRPSCHGCQLPHPSSIGRYLHQWSRFCRQRRIKPKQRPKAAAPTAVHQRWQLDFKVNIEQADGQKLALHTLVDQYSGACITAQLLPKKTAVQKDERITWREAQATLRCGFSLWGTMPQEVQTDNETALIGRPGMDFPSDFTLWLKGLGISYATIRPGKCTDNAEVERGHRTIHDYAIVGQENLPVSDLQLTVQQAARELTFALSSHAKSCNDRPPVSAYPELLTPLRPYQLAHEFALFDLSRVDAFLASFHWLRQTDKVGTLQLGGHKRRYCLGRKYAYVQCYIRFDPADRQLVFALGDNPQQEICRRPIRQVTAWELIGLDDPSVELIPQQLPLFPEVL